MSSQVDLYDNAYAKVDNELYRTIRTETYGQDLGQTSWVTSEESDLIPVLLSLNSNSVVLDIGCGSGGYAIYLAKRLGCRVDGLDVNPHAIASATQIGAASALDDLVRFEQCDLSKPFRFADATFNAAFANDVLCHVPDRPHLLKELFRVLRPGARLLFSDALIVGGVVSHLELATRSSVGLYFFSPPGENERLLASAGFTLLSVSDTSEQAAAIAKRWHNARERQQEQLIGLEGLDRYEGLQRFLAGVHQLTSERRLLRSLYVAQKPGSDSAS